MKPSIKLLEPQVWQRAWGEEILLIHTDLYTGKLLKMNKGTRGGLQYHRIKNEAQYLYKGSLMIEYDDGTGHLATMTVGEGQSWHIPPGVVHRETALEDCLIFEVSNPVFNDRVRVEEKYGEKYDGGLPTTEESDIRVG